MNHRTRAASIIRRTVDHIFGTGRAQTPTVGAPVVVRLSADAARVELRTVDLVEPMLDRLAEAFRVDPVTVGARLRILAAARTPGERADARAWLADAAGITTAPTVGLTHYEAAALARHTQTLADHIRSNVFPTEHK